MNCPPSHTHDTVIEVRFNSKFTNSAKLYDANVLPDTLLAPPEILLRSLGLQIPRLSNPDSAVRQQPPHVHPAHSFHSPAEARTTVMLIRVAMTPDDDRAQPGPSGLFYAVLFLRGLIFGGANPISAVNRRQIMRSTAAQDGSHVSV